MKRIEVRGMLVGAEYDDPFMHREVENGIFTPSSKVIREIDEANGDDIEIFVDSEGGDVFAFHSALDKILNYPGNITFMIGATAFSEAANFVLLSKRPVKCYPFSVMLFHSAMSTVYDGAAGELRSEADILEKINAPVKWALKMHGIPESEVEEGFRDGCALVLGMDDLVKYGIATVVEEESPVTKRLDESISMRLVALAEANQRIAAHYHSTKVNNTEMSKKSRKAQKATKAEETEEQKLLEEETQEQQTAEETVPEETKQEEQPVEETQQEEAPAEEQPAEEQQQEEAPAEEQPAEENKPEEETEEVAEEEAPAEEEKPEEVEAPEAEESDDDKLLKTLEVLQGSVSTLTDRLNALEEKLTEKEVELQDAKKALKAERTKRIGALAAAVSGKAGDTRPADWSAAVKACNGDKLEAYKKYPDLAKAWAKTN